MTSYMKINPLVKLGNVPVQTGTIAACFDHLLSPNEKIRALEKDGQLIRLKRGLYVVSDEVSGKPVNAYLCANHIYGTSYVSQQWALRWYGLIPERVYTMTSVTTKRTRMFENSIGRFSYEQVKPEYFAIGIDHVEEDGITFLIASREKALCDMILHDSYLPPQSVKGLLQYLEEDIRFDMDELVTFDVSIIEACAKLGRKEMILNNLIKILKR
jgi:predicted transcriptional regulator of viral defense system